MVTETEWYAREAKFLIPRLEFGPNVVLMDGLWMENKTELHSKALEKKSDFRMWGCVKIGAASFVIYCTT